MPVPFNDLGRQYRTLRETIKDALVQVAESGWYALGPEHNAFEREFAAYLGATDVLGVANGTDAIEIALRALGVGPGDEVITAPNAGGYSTTAILLTGAAPVYADVDDATLTLCPESIQAHLSPLTKAVVVTHLYGQAADMPAITNVLAPSGVPVVEDCAQSHGARIGAAHTGTLGAMGTFSFYPTKNLGALGDGGCIATNDPELADKVRLLRQYGWESKYRSVVPYARNSRLDEIQAAILRRKLPYLDAWNDRRRDIVRRYAAAVADTRVEMVHQPGDDYVGHLCIIRCPNRDKLQKTLEEHGVQTAVHYPYLDYTQPALANVPWRTAGTPRCEKAVTGILSLPCFPELTDDEVNHVCSVLASAATE